ncbi:hypothetical protein HCU40_17135 [Pseudanabaena biceps]|nr:hypothetical protein [Pseudanabaena biceps]
MYQYLTFKNKKYETNFGIFSALGAENPKIGFTAVSDQTNQKHFFESVSKQHFQKNSWFGFERKAL